VTAKGVTNSGFVTPEQPVPVTPNLEADSGWPPRWMTPVQWRAWMHQHRPAYCQALRVQAGTYREYTNLPAGQYNRVSKPGDPDYVGVCCKDDSRWLQTWCKA